MSNCYYSPNSKSTGGALFCTWNSKEGHVYFKVLKQVANNPDKKKNFDGKNPINLKLSQDEAADIVRAVREKGESKFIHKFDETTTNGNFKYYEAESPNGKRYGFGFTIRKMSNGVTQEAKIGFSLGAAERFSLFLQNALVHIFDAEYSLDKKKYTDAQKSKTEQQEPVPTENNNEDF